MRQLRVIGVEDGALLASGDDGAEYRIDVDPATVAELRRGRSAVEGKRVPPKEIQAHIRAGMSAADVATLTGADLGYVERFEGPVIAERDWVVESALNIPVRTASDSDEREGTSFGAVIRDRLAAGSAADERWASWKDPEAGWIVKLTFTAESVEHDARWTFEPRTHALSPLNAEAVALSQQGTVPPSLIPRLRAVERDERPDRARFDSDAFTIEEGDLAGPLDPQFAARPAPVPMNQTADLLEALRRRRGERENMLFEAEEPEPRAGIRLVDVPLEGRGGAGEPESAPRDTGPGDASDVPVGSPSGRPSHASTASRSARRNRAAMPSWDEIVFGARTDDDA